MKEVDAAVIGGGVLGCFAARNLMRWNISAVLIEAKEDVCTEITRANSAVVYSGYDNQAGSLKAEMTVRGNREFSQLCEELDVPFVRRGSLLVSFGPRGERVLQRKYENGMANRVPGLQLLSQAEALLTEPHLSEKVTAALYAPTTGTVNPWQLGIAAYENALQNGCESMLNTRVVHIQKYKEHYVIETERDTILCKTVLNCAGLAADKIQEMIFQPRVRLFPDAADFLVFDKHAPTPEHIIFQESEEKGKGITAVPATEGNLLLESPKRPMTKEPFAASSESLDFLRRAAEFVLPDIDFRKVIRSFGAVRPNPHKVVRKDGQYVPDGKSIGSFVIDHPAEGFCSLIGIKTPGLTCANELGQYLAQQTALYLGADENKGFQAMRKGIIRIRNMEIDTRQKIVRENPDYGEIVCMCEEITKGEVLEAIRRGAVSVRGVKSRVGTGMGRCQGGRCSQKIQRMLEEVAGR